MATDGTEILVRGRFALQPDRLLPDLDSVAAFAVAATDRRNSALPLFGLVSRGEVPPRLGAVPAMLRVDAGPLLRLLDFARVDWPGAGRRVALVFERPRGHRLVPRGASRFPAMPADQVARRILAPVAQALRLLNDRRIRHRAVRLDNLFVDGAEGSPVVLGEGLTAPPAMDQPACYETIENAMARPFARRASRLADDLYALGVCGLALALGRVPLAHLADRDVVTAKLETGSYAALAGSSRFDGGLAECLRGLLADSAAERWTLNDLELWLNGRRQSPRQAGLPPRAVRPFSFQGRAYVTARALSMALADDPAAAGTAIDPMEIESWLRRSVGDAAAAERVAALGAGAALGGRDRQRDALVARLCLALDPAAPLRYRGLSVMPDALGTTLALGMGDAQTRADFVEMVTGSLPQHWARLQDPADSDVDDVLRVMRALQGFLASQAAGQGLERCLYHLNPALPCQSPALVADLVSEAADLPAAMEAAAARGTYSSLPLDRHVTAFLAGRVDRLLDDALSAFALRADPAERAVAALAALAHLQALFGPERMPALTALAARCLAPAIARTRNRTTRSQLAGAVERAALGGELGALLSLVADPGRQHADDRGFAAAAREYAEMEAEIRALSLRPAGDRSDLRFGRQMAALGCGVIASLVVGIVLVA